MNQQIPLKVSVIVTSKNNKPQIELRRAISDLELIKLVVTAAFYGNDIIIVPTFTDTLQSINSLIDKGILYRHEIKKKLFFTY